LGQQPLHLIKRLEKENLIRDRRNAFLSDTWVQSKAYRLWDPEARKVIRNRDVTFTGRNQAENDFTDFIYEEIFKKNPENVIEFNVRETQKEDKQTETCDLEEDGETLVEEENGEEIPVIMKRGLGRAKKILTGKQGRPRKLFNMIEVNEQKVEPEEEENHENEELHDVAGLIEFADPQTVSEALSSPEAADWKRAMNAEYEALKRNQTWIIVDRPQGKKTVESRWVLRTKLKKDGSVHRRKARLLLLKNLVLISTKRLPPRQDSDQFVCSWQSQSN
jgi:hypothetical protein